MNLEFANKKLALFLKKFLLRFKKIRLFWLIFFVFLIVFIIIIWLYIIGPVWLPKAVDKGVSNLEINQVLFNRMEQGMEQRINAGSKILDQKYYDPFD